MSPTNISEAVAPRQRLAFLHRQPDEETGGIEDFVEGWQVIRAMGRAGLRRLGIGREADPAAATRPGIVGDIADLIETIQRFGYTARELLNGDLTRRGWWQQRVIGSSTPTNRVAWAALMRSEQDWRYYDQYCGPGTMDNGQSDYAKDREAAAWVATDEAMLTRVVADAGGFDHVRLDRLAREMARAVDQAEAGEEDEIRRQVARRYIGQHLTCMAILENQYPEAMDRVVESAAVWGAHQPTVTRWLKERTSPAGLLRRGVQAARRRVPQTVRMVASIGLRLRGASTSPAQLAGLTSTEASGWDDDPDDTYWSEPHEVAPIAAQPAESAGTTVPQVATVAVATAPRQPAAELKHPVPSVEELVRIARQQHAAMADVQAAVSQSAEPGYSIIRRLERAGVLEGLAFERLAATITESQTQLMERYVAMQPEERRAYFPDGIQTDELRIVMRRDVNDFLTRQGYELGLHPRETFIEVRDHIIGLVLARRQAAGTPHPEVPGELSVALRLPVRAPDLINGGEHYPRARHFQQQLTANPGILFEDGQAGINARHLYISLRKLGFRFTVPGSVNPAAGSAHSRPTQP